MSRVKIPSWANIRNKPDFDALYQEILVSGTNLRTVNGQSLLGSGNIAISGSTDASLLTSGTLADARLSANVARRDQANTISQTTGNPTLEIVNGGNSGQSAALRVGTALVGLHVSGVNYQTTVISSGAAVVPFRFRGAAGQTANLAQWENSSSTVLASINSIGRFTTSATVRPGSFTIATLPTAEAGLVAYISDAATIAFATASQWRYSPSLPLGTVGFFVPVGGTTGQALVKSSGTDGATEWATISGGGGSATDLSIANRTSTTLDVLSSTGTDVTLPEASTAQAGLLNATDKSKLSVAAFTFRLDGGGVAITTGAKKVLFRVPFACTITSWELVADVTGSIVLDLWRDTYSTFPPANADSITGSAKPTLTASDKAQSSTLTGWTTSLAAGDYIEIEVESAATITVAVLTLNLSRS